MIMYDILSINASINTWFRESKLPKFLKKILAKNRRKKLYKKIDKFTDSDKVKYRAIDIYEFFSYCSTSLEGKFMYIENLLVIDDSSPIYGTVLKFKDEKDKIIYYFRLDNIKMDSLNIAIRQESDKGIQTIAKFDCKGFNEITLSNHNEIECNLIGGLNAMIAEMMKSLLYSELERSERIYEL